MRELMVLIAFAASTGSAVAQPLYNQGVTGSATGQGAGQSYVSPYNEPARNSGGGYGVAPGALYGAPPPQGGSWNLLAPAPPQPPAVPDYDDRMYNRRTR